MIVIKLGGSLLTDSHALRRCLNTIERKFTKNIVIVPGGGVFADQVRCIQQQWEFNDQIAHQMALLSMQQMALLFKSIKPTFELANNISAIKQILLNHSVVIWMPDFEELDSKAVKASWDVTSDSLAAWLTEQLAATELILVKSSEIPLKIDFRQMQEQEVVDNAFNEYIKNSSYRITLINKHRFNEYPFT